MLLHCDLKHALTVLVKLLDDFVCLDVEFLFICFYIGQVVLSNGLTLNPIQQGIYFLVRVKGAVTSWKLVEFKILNEIDVYHLFELFH